MKIIVVILGVMAVNQSMAESCYDIQKNSTAYQICMLRKENKERDLDNSYREKINDEKMEIKEMEMKRIADKNDLDRRIEEVHKYNREREMQENISRNNLTSDEMLGKNQYKNNCKVLDEDIVGIYTGECQNGLAQGAGRAKGRDEYYGVFFEGKENGQGIYTWGKDSDWFGEWYEGEYLNGKKNGFGISGIDKNAKNKEVVEEYKKEGIGDGHSYVRRGYFENDVFVIRCKNSKICFGVLEQGKKNFEKGNYFVGKNEFLKANFWLKKSAEQGDAGAQTLLGINYLLGRGIGKDTSKGIDLLYISALRGRPSAQVTLGKLFDKTNPLEAKKWYDEAAKQGEAMAQYELGRMYEYGLGGQKDDERAARLYQLAAEKGYADAINRLENRKTK